MNINYQTLSAGWNQIISNGALNLKRIVSGMIDPGLIQLQLVSETPDEMTVSFSGFDQALEDPERDGPILKRAILSWIKNFAQAQIARGDPSVFMVKITKISLPDEPAAPPQMESVRGNLANISNVRKLNAKKN